MGSTGMASNKERVPEERMDVKIKVRKFNAYYGDLHAVKHVDIDIHENRILSLIGPSGCGKSTFLRHVNRMNDYVEGSRATGEMLYNGQNIIAKETNVTHLRMHIGMVFQKPNPFPKTIYENLAFGPRKLGVRKRATLDQLVERSLRDAVLWEEVKDKLHKSAYELSGGQQQRLCIARCIAMQPDVLLMDEPTSALDPISTGKIENLMDSLRRKYTIIIVTHSMEQAARISDETAFFLNGEVIESSSTLELFSNPRKKETDDYIRGRFG